MKLHQMFYPQCSVWPRQWNRQWSLSLRTLRRWSRLPLNRQCADLVRMVRNTLIAAVALLRDSFAVIGLTAILTIVLVTQNERLRHALLDNAWLQPTASIQRANEQALLSVLAQDDGERSSGLMGLAASTQKVVFQEPASLQNQQQTLSRFLARKYRLSDQAVQLVVEAAYVTGKQVEIDPLLILAVMAVESSFNPFAESVVGAQGLMQVMTRVHEDKFDAYGGKLAALNPVANIKVGAIILRDCIRRGGSVEAGLKLYVGATTETDGGYGAKVLMERARLQMALGMRPELPAPAKTVANPALPVPAAVNAPTPVPELAPADLPKPAGAIEARQEQQTAPLHGV